MLKEVAFGCCEPVRVVDVVLLRLLSCPDTGRLLVETGRRCPEGGSPGADCLPGAAREPNESPEETVARIQSDVLRAGRCSMRFDFDRTETFGEEPDPEPSAGPRTLYRTRIVEGHVTCTDAALRASIGLEPAGPGGAAWSAEAEEAPAGARHFVWLTEREALERRVRLRGDGLGALALPLLVPAPTGGRPQGPLGEAVAELSARLDGIFQKDRRLPDLERGLGALGAWLGAEHAAAPPALLRERARRRYVAQHAGELRAFARALGELERLQACINPPSLRELPAQARRLVRLEARGAVAASAAARLHERVAGLAAEYCQAMSSVSAQMASWDRLLGDALQGRSGAEPGPGGAGAK